MTNISWKSLGFKIAISNFKILWHHCVAVYGPEKSTDQTQSMPLNLEGVLKMQLPENQLLFAMGPSIKAVGIFLAFFDTPLPHVGILTLINLSSTFLYLVTLEVETPLPPKVFRRIFMGGPLVILPRLCSNNSKQHWKGFQATDYGLLGLSRQFGQINFGAFGVFSANLSEPIMVQWVPCPCFPLIKHCFYQKN